MSRSRRRRTRLRSMPLAVAVFTVAAVALSVAVRFCAGGSPAGGASLTVRNAADAAGPLTASYQEGTSWGTGYSGQYTIANPGSAPVTGWTLGFTLPAGTSLTSLWDGSYTVSGGRVTVVRTPAGAQDRRQPAAQSA